MKIFWLALVTLLLAACSRVTPENFAQLKTGMERTEVYALIGSPDQVSGGGVGPLTVSSETWEGSKHRIDLTFTGDRLALKQINPREAK